MTRTPLLLLLGLVGLGGAAGFAWHASRAPAPMPPSAKAASPAIPVISGLATRRSLPFYFAGLGTVQAFNTVTVRVQVDGELQTVAFAEGQHVKAGDLLAQIDPRPFQARLAQAQAAKRRAEAELANARRNLARLASLATRDFATKQSLDNQEALVEQLAATVAADQASIDDADLQLGYTTIRSPIDGYAGLRLVDQGNIVHANDPNGLVVITQRQPIAVVFTLPQDALGEVSRAWAAGPLKVLVFSRDDQSQIGEGALEVIDNQVDQGTGTIRMKAVAPNAQNRLWPGEFVNAHLVVSLRPDAVTVPARVVQHGQAGAYAYVVRPDQTVELRPIKVGEVRDGIAVIEAGLAAGERVVIDGQYRLRPGSRVEVDSATAPPPAGDAPS